MEMWKLITATELNEDSKSIEKKAHAAIIISKQT